MKICFAFFNCAITLLFFAELSITQASEVESLIQKGMCGSCHHQTRRRMGPSYQEIAAKHREDPAGFFVCKDVIQNGSSNGRMAAVRNLSDQEVTELVKWILAQAPTEIEKRELAEEPISSSEASFLEEALDHFLNLFR